MSYYHLGEMYRDGIGTEKSGKNAVSWFKKAGNKGYYIAWYSIAQIFEKGCAEIAPDHEKAIEYYEMAERRGYMAAPYRFGDMYMKGDMVPKDRRKAIECYKRSADMGYYPARMKLYTIYTEDPRFRNISEAGKMLDRMRRENRGLLEKFAPKLL